MRIHGFTSSLERLDWRMVFSIHLQAESLAIVSSANQYVGRYLPWCDCHKRERIGLIYGLFEGFQVRKTKWRNQLTGYIPCGEHPWVVRWVCVNITSSLTQEKTVARYVFIFLGGKEKQRFFPQAVQHGMSFDVSFLSYRNIRVVINCLTLIKLCKRFQITFLKTL